MIRFNCDYSEGAHEKVLERLIATNRSRRRGMEQIIIRYRRKS